MDESLTIHEYRLITLALLFMCYVCILYAVVSKRKLEKCIRSYNKLNADFIKLKGVKK